MKVVLLENIKGLGQKGETKEVKDGYGMNFLIPQKKAVPATSATAKQVELELKKENKNREEELIANKKLAKTLRGKNVTMKAKAQKGKLFGALTEKEIKKELAGKGLEVGSGKIILEKPIKKIGQFTLKVQWHDNVETEFELNVVEES